MNEPYVTKNIKKLKRIFDNCLELNKKIVDDQAIVVVPAKKAGKMLVNDVDIFDDFLFFCFTKFTKTTIAINRLIQDGLYEDAMILTRSNYEAYINAKAVVFDPDMITHLVEYKLGLIDETRYKHHPKLKNKIIDINDTEKVLDYKSSIKKVAEAAQEEISYQVVYDYLCAQTHCNLITSGYYRDGVNYSYDLQNESALFNVLLWNTYFNVKFFGCLIEGEMFEIDELENYVIDTNVKYSLSIMKFFEEEIKRVMPLLETDELSENDRGKLSFYIKNLQELKQKSGV